MKVFIRSAACISAQKTFKNEGFLDDIAEFVGTRAPIIEPDYKEYFDPKAVRRMSPVVKRGVAAGLECLKQADVKMPGAIVTGTALGCITDTVTFMDRLVDDNEEMLPPTAFIQSTHNTVAAQVALSLHCHAYNNTFVHKGISFESALLDGMMLLREQEANNVLVGGTEEMVDVSFKVLTRLGLFKRWPVSNLELFKPESKGTIGGEGCAFFLLNDQSSPDNLAELTAIKVLYQPQNIGESIKSFLADNDLSPADVDLVITGRNGDIKNDAIYQPLISDLFSHNAIGNYKHLCGEYPVSSSFALWLAANILKRCEVPEVVYERDSPVDIQKTILIYNHYQGKYHSLMLVSAI